MENAQFEMEMKFRVADPERLRARLLSMGALSQGREIESDEYFRSPLRDFGVTGEALRLRSVGAEQILTYKGSRLPGPTKIRKELELAIQPLSGTMPELLKLLGFEPLAPIRKWRETFVFQDLTKAGISVCLDDAEGLGWFAEIEILAPLQEKQAAVKRIQNLARELELTDVEDRSYLRMHLEKGR